MTKTRVLVVDDSSVIRRILTDILSREPDMEVVGTAANGNIALGKFQQLKPDVVTLDVEMPDMNGLELLERIRKQAHKQPIIMFSSLTERAGSTTLEALARGATDYVTKPSKTGSREASEAHIREQLVPKIRALGHREPPPARTATPPIVTTPIPVATKVQLIAVGASTGGPNALVTLFRSTPRFEVPVVIVQHMPPLFTRLLADRISKDTTMPCSEATDGTVLVPGQAYVAPGDYHMRIVREGGRARISLAQDLPVNSCRPSVDVLFKSVASTFGDRALAVVLTGMGQDGLRGAEALREVGGYVVAQDESSSVVWGMPGFVARAGLANAVLPLEDIGPTIFRRAANSSAKSAHEAGHAA